MDVSTKSLGECNKAPLTFKGDFFWQRGQELLNHGIGGVFYNRNGLACVASVQNRKNKASLHRQGYTAISSTGCARSGLRGWSQRLTLLTIIDAAAHIGFSLDYRSTDGAGFTYGVLA